MAKPTSIPEWATDGGAEKTEPAAGSKQTGFRAGYTLPSNWINWLLYTLYTWVYWLDSKLADGTTGDRLGAHGLDSTATNTNGSGAITTGNGTGNGVYGTGGASSGRGGYFVGGATNGHGSESSGSGSGTGGIFNAGATGPNINLAARSGDPSTLNNGDIWFDGTNFKCRVGGATKTFTIA